MRMITFFIFLSAFIVPKVFPASIEKGIIPTNGRIKPLGCNTAFIEIAPQGRVPRGEVLLLHGERYSSATWNDLGTLFFLASKGLRAVAIDLPGYGASERRIDREGDADFMMAVMQELGLRLPIIVVPSASGKYGIPLIIEYPSALAGWVSIAPSGATKIFSDVYAQLNIRTLIIWGQNDRGGQQGANALQAIPGSKSLMIPNAGHACYLENTDLFHTGLAAFALSIK